MLVKEVMQRAICIGPDETLAAAARKLKEHNIGCLPVCEEGRVLGIITDRDIAMRSIAERRSAEQVTAREAMSVDVFWCSEDHSVNQAADLMRGAHVRRLVVLDGRRRLAGVVSMTDLGGCASERRPYEIIFYKEILDHAGLPHHSEVMRVAVAQGTREEAIQDAVREFKRSRQVGDWRAAADGFDVIDTHAGR